MSLSGSKSKSKETVDQTQKNTLSDRAAGMLTGGISDLQGKSYQAFDPASMAQFQDPFQSQVRDATLAQMDFGNAQAWNDLDSRLAQSKAFGDDRRGVLEAGLAGDQARERASMLAGLNSQGFQQARDAALGENQNANSYDLQIQALINQLRGGFTNEGTQKLNGTTTGVQKSRGFGFSYGGG